MRIVATLVFAASLFAHSHANAQDYKAFLAQLRDDEPPLADVFKLEFTDSFYEKGELDFVQRVLIHREGQRLNVDITDDLSARAYKKSPSSRSTGSFTPKRKVDLLSNKGNRLTGNYYHKSLTLSRNPQKPFAFGLRDDIHWSPHENAENLFSPHPGQMISQPCFFPLRFSPSELENEWTFEGESEDSLNGVPCQVIRFSHEKKSRELALYVSQEHFPFVLQSSFSFISGDGQTHRRLRTVTDFRTDDSNAIIPLSYRLLVSNGGEEVQRLEREFSIFEELDDLPDDLFSEDIFPNTWAFNDQKLGVTIPRKELQEAPQDLVDAAMSDLSSGDTNGELIAGPQIQTAGAADSQSPPDSVLGRDSPDATADGTPLLRVLIGGGASALLLFGIFLFARRARA